jgi:hypothetical protein
MSWLTGISATPRYDPSFLSSAVGETRHGAGEPTVEHS